MPRSTTIRYLQQQSHDMVDPSRFQLHGLSKSVSSCRMISYILFLASSTDVILSESSSSSYQLFKILRLCSSRELAFGTLHAPDLDAATQLEPKSRMLTKIFHCILMEIATAKKKVRSILLSSVPSYTGRQPALLSSYLFQHSRVRSGKCFDTLWSHEQIR